MKLPASPFAPKTLPAMPEVAGVRLATAQTGMKYKNRPDLLMVVCDEGTHVACATTQSTTVSSAVDLCRSHAADGKGRLLLVNASKGISIAGRESTAETMNVCSVLTKVPFKESFMCSTGVIGELLPAESIIAHISALHSKLKPTGWYAATRSIMTTDTYPKCLSATLEIDGKPVTINGIAKGSGMIAPNMATMLCFFFTDAAIEPECLQRVFARCTDQSFNCITVDGDTSTSDTGLLFATGKAGNKPMINDGQAKAFEGALLALMQELAQQIIKDGEGAQKFVTVQVNGAADDKAARMIGMSIANSPLVKTAIAGGDANWGRVVMAVGKAGEQAPRDKLTVSFGGQLAAKDGQLNPDYDEAAATEHVGGREVSIEVDIGVASGTATIWTCDLTHGYIDINGDYRT